MTTKAVFLLTDFHDKDPYLRWLRPFLVSYCTFNSMPLVCIPCGMTRANEAEYRAHMENRLQSIKGQLHQMVDFHLYVDWADFEWCESLTNDYLESVRKRYRHHIAGLFERSTYVRAEKLFRKLCILQQKEYEEIIYVDIDSVVLKNLQPLFNFLKYYDIGFGSQSRKEDVYNDQIDLTPVLGRDISYYNDGMILLKKELFSRETIDETMKFGDENDLFTRHGYDQAVLNLATMRTGVKHVDMRSAIWANDKFEVKNGEVIGKPEGYVVHWAGSKKGVTHKELIRRFDPTFDH